MSYDIELQRRNGDVVYVDTPFLMHGGTVPAYVDEHGVLRQATQREAHVNITYNYARYYYDATEGDARFEKGSGIRGLYGKTAVESIPMLVDMIRRIDVKFRNADGTWMDTMRKKKVYFDASGREVSPMDSGIVRAETVFYLVNEGHTDDYWEATAVNAITPLRDMLHLATEFISEDVVWMGD